VSLIDHARRTSFGTVAAQYHASRPSYPAELVADVVRYAGASSGSRALEVGAGTGIATDLFAAHGLEIDAIEPSAEMAAVASEQAGSGAVRYRIERLEDADLEPRSFQLIYSGQAWHWVEPYVGERIAAHALSAGGALACFWNWVDWSQCPERPALDRAYSEIGWDKEIGPMMPRAASVRSPEVWTERIDATVGFEAPEIREYLWRQTYSTAQYIALLGTHSDHILLEQELRNRLFGAVAGVIEGAGGTIELVYSTRLCLARATGE
jgi:SAM-dependent methyltransferase